jgi:peptide/nickel transport system substrate-binding protein
MGIVLPPPIVVPRLSAIEAQVLATHSFVPLAAERARLGVAEGVSGVAQDPLERIIVTVDTAKS